MGTTIQAKIKLEVWPGWLVMDDFVNRQVYWHLQLCVRHASEMTKYMYIECVYSREYLGRNCMRSVFTVGNIGDETASGSKLK